MSMTDLRSAARHVLRRPGFLLLGASALGAGLAATILVFGVLNTLMLRPMPGITTTAPLAEIGRIGNSGDLDTVSYPDFRDLAEQSRSFDEIFAYRFAPAYVSEGDTPRSALAMLTSGNYFAALGVRALHGQLFGPSHDAVSGRDPVVVLSERAFRRHFNADPTVVGRTMRINGSDYTVLGVAADFAGHVAAIAPEVFVPLSMTAAMKVRDDYQHRTSYWLKLGGRLSPDSTIEQGRAELATLSAGLDVLVPDRRSPLKFDAVPLRPLPQAAHAIVGFLAAGLLVMCGAILALACTNLAGILLAQGEARAPELAMRSALGASRARIARQLMFEAGFVAVAAGGIGLLLAFLGRDLLALVPLPVPFPLDLAVVIDARVVVFALGASALVALAFGLLPALKVSASAPAAGIGSGTTARRTPRSRQWLLATQSALTVALLLVAALTLVALGRAGTIDTGFRTDAVFTANINLEPLGLSSDEAVERLDQLLVRLRAQPGIEHASFASVIPLTMSRLGYGATRLPGSEDSAVATDANTVGDGFFDVFALPVRGRPIVSADGANAPQVTVINQRLADRVFGDKDPIGAEIEMGGGDSWRRLQVVGVVPDGRYSTLTDTDRAFAFLPAAQWERTEFELFIHGPVDPLTLQQMLADEIRQLVPDLPPPQVHRFADMAALSILPQKVLGGVAAALGVLALVLAATGLYGVLAYQIERRYREFGVRRALGASASQVANALLRRTLIWLIGGAAIGLFVAQFMAAALGDLLFGVGGGNPVALAVTFMAFSMMTAVAIAVPLRRALRLEPMLALRYE